MIGVSCSKCGKPILIKETDLLAHRIEVIDRFIRAIHLTCPFCGEEAQVFYMNKKLCKGWKGRPRGRRNEAHRAKPY